MVAATRLRGGNAGSARAAASLVKQSTSAHPGMGRHRPVGLAVGVAFDRGACLGRGSCPGQAGLRYDVGVAGVRQGAGHGFPGRVVPERDMF